MAQTRFKVERDGWYVEIEVLDVAKRPHWEVRCGISRSREDGSEAAYRGNRLYVSPEIAESLRLDRLSDAKRRDRLGAAAKKLILREIEEIFSEPGGGLDALRPLTEADLKG